MVFIHRSGNHVFLDPFQRKISWDLRHPNLINWTFERLIVQQTLAALTPRQKQMAEYWGNGMLTEKIRRIIFRLADKYNIGATKLAFVLGYFYAAVNDAFVMSMYFKYLYDTARPIQYGSNVAAVIDTPQSPSYPSGHAAIAGCSQMVLSHFFPSESASIQRKMEECAQSRVYAGVHFKADIEAGLKLGRQIGKIVMYYMKG
ncbi:vanadium-dependent haloperoxidase [Niallia endozanthoxylica]|uniref:Vanadium-dependent haloperoxidase n=2 Tax=Niallia endozanthoxylica TaxID=2036016 RepID=A0A5J5I4Y1_9BACI|nr:vanadium-dependent haloperoxidase [Niallia endozanthoxylica]